MDKSGLVAWDFNQIADSSEKFGGRSVRFKSCQTFKNNIAQCKLFDLGFQGSKFSWSNKRFTNKNILIQECLDRYLANDNWINFFLDSKVYHLFNRAKKLISSKLVLGDQCFKIMWAPLIDHELPLSIVDV